MNRKLFSAFLCASLLSVSGCSSSNAVSTTGGTTTKTEEKEADPDLAIVSSGYYVTPPSEYSETAYVTFWAKVQNQSDSKSISFPTITCTATSDDGTVLGTEDQVGSSILPGDICMLVSLMDTGTTAPTNVQITAKKPEYVSSSDGVKTSDFTIDGVSEQDQGYGMTKVTGTLTYAGDSELSMVAVTAIYKSGDTDVYATQTYLDNVQPNTATAFELSPMTSDLPAHDSIEVIAQNW